jgi:hypothetical protein
VRAFPGFDRVVAGTAEDRKDAFLDVDRIVPGPAIDGGDAGEVDIDGVVAAQALDVVDIRVGCREGIVAGRPALKRTAAGFAVKESSPDVPPSSAPPPVSVMAITKFSYEIPKPKVYLSDT